LGMVNTTCRWATGEQTSSAGTRAQRWSVQRGQQRPLLVAGGTCAALLAGESDEPGTMLAWSVLTVGAANSGEAFLQIAALEKGGHRLLDDRSRPASGCPTVLGLITLVVDLLEGVKMLIQQLPQVGCVRIAWLVEW